ncbi:isoleucine--tRNA ligase [Parasphingorhabdus sp. DH2-15]|uniref:isoleucine--tRNA ligase n=1 Tax=Parasphingorhabdus sp. DH2-15 TaxID=3444112 RepID=UPI003F68924C
MSEQTSSETVDYKDTVFLPKTDFPMRAGLANKEPGILARWRDEKLYETLRKRRAGKEKFILHDGPPYANGDIHIGHALNKTLKDLVVRTQSLLGKDAPYVPGWDCHGLPIEWKIEEQYRKKKRNKDEVPASEFRAECRSYADNWVNVQREQFQRLGIMGEWDKPYLTMDYTAETTIVSELLKFAENGQLYRGAKPIMWSPVEKTALAEAEVEYEDIISTQIDVAFEIIEAPNCPAIQELIAKGEKVHAVIWTTTPWTIPVNQALAFGADVKYVVATLCVDTHGDREAVATFLKQNPSIDFLGDDFKVLIAKPLLEQFATRFENWLKSISGEVDLRLSEFEFEDGNYNLESAQTIKGSQLAGAMAKHPMADAFSSSLPFRGGTEGGDEPHAPDQIDSPHPKSSPEGEGLEHIPSINRDAELAEFFTRPRPFLDGSSFVTTDAGTGLVHMAPDHGEDDFDLCKANGLNPVFAVEADGVYRADWAWLPRGDARSGSVINTKFTAANGPICNDLRAAGALLSADDFKHSYPHSWRSKAKIIYRCTPQWFVPMDTPLPEHVRNDADTVSPELVEGRLTSADKRALPLRQAQGSALTDEGVGHGKGVNPSLRDVALDEIRNTVRFVPERGKRRLESMVEGRPDWVLSRQRAWGVPIALYVNRKSGDYLNDPAVNARIIAAFQAGGADAWFDADHQALLGADHDLADYEVVNDILDVWFDSGCTHSFVLESGNWPDHQSPADLYLEGSDQHRGWFQSSLLESCGTRGRAPYKAVLTHGMTLDKTGRKMSKSLGNTLDPKKVINAQGADILRLWAASVDFTEDHRIGDEILKTVSDSYRKLRNTFRYMLGALADYDAANEATAYDDLPELERYILHRLAELDAGLKQAVNDFAFGKYVRAISDFVNDDLSAFFFDIRKDCLYCDVGPHMPHGTQTRRAYRTVVNILFEALTRYIAPVLVFTAEEIWMTRYPEGESVHLQEWPDVDSGWYNADLADKWQKLSTVRHTVNEAIEPLRREKTIRSSLEADIVYPLADLPVTPDEFAELCIIAGVSDGTEIAVTKTTHHKCGRCWRLIPDVPEDGALCSRCDSVLNG